MATSVDVMQDIMEQYVKVVSLMYISHHTDLAIRVDIRQTRLVALNDGFLQIIAILNRVFMAHVMPW